MSVITDDGVSLSTLEEITTENTTLYQEFTGDVDVSASSASGELIAIVSEMEARNEQLIADAFSQNTIGSATGQNLDNIATIKNQARILDQKSIVYIEITGVDTTIVPQGTEFVCASNNEKFFSEYEVAVSGTTAFVSAASENIGVSCPALNISIVTPIVDITSVKNNTPAIVGQTEESDASLRGRLSTIGSPLTVNLKEGLFLALFEIQNVVKVKILDNNTDSVIDGVPARTFSPVVQGGNNANVAQVVFNYMGVGNPSFGDTAQLIKAVTGDTYNVAFNRPIELLTVVSVTLSTNSDFNTSTGIEEVKDNIVAYFNSLDIGEDLLTQKIATVCLITGVESAIVLTDGTSVNKFSTFKEVFVTNLSSVTVA